MAAPLGLQPSGMASCGNSAAERAAEGGNPLPFGDQKAVSRDAERCMMMDAGHPRPSKCREESCLLRSAQSLRPSYFPQQRALTVQLSENASADVENGRPSRCRGHDRPLASTPLRTRRVPSAGINTVQTP